jgi:hypothetical protein
MRCSLGKEERFTFYHYYSNYKDGASSSLLFTHGPKGGLKLTFYPF